MSTDYSFVHNAHPSFIENMYNKYMNDETSVEDGWRTFFEGFEFKAFGEAGINGSESASAISSKEFGVFSIIYGFRSRGHLLSKTNPIKERRNRQPHLDLHDYGLESSDLNERFHAGDELGLKNATLQEILDRLKKVYCGTIGFEFSHIENRDKRNWLRDKIENRSLEDDFGIPIEKKKRILEKLNGAVVFERFLHKKYVGQKRFSLEGGETAIVALDGIISSGGEFGVKEVVIGMAHRGRLNVLTNIMGKTYEEIFNEFEGTAVPDLSFGDGDVKYHLGFSSQVKTFHGKDMELKMAPNPSHLESVDPVVQGYARAKADMLYNHEYDHIMPVLIHGDAAIAGQGIVYETVQMSQLPGYYTGGTVHLIINNQVGFTTNFDDARSSTYCTGVASLIQAPVVHVNGDDPEAVLYAVQLAIAYRQKFNNDVFIDMVCYRRHGHNEGDDPKFTQPTMYEIINKHPNPREIYIDKLMQRGEVERELADSLESKFWNDLQARLDLIKENPLPFKPQTPAAIWASFKKAHQDDFSKSPVTGIKKATITKVLEHLMTYPDDFNLLSKVNRLLKSKRKLIDANEVDWGLGELLAYASILLDGKDVRMSGQDVKRGTFSHRHAIFADVKTERQYNRLEGMSEDQGDFMIYNSLLSEFAVLGFEYGYSIATPQSLVIWEAQFGDFYNGAQTIVDQYITAAESKWQWMSGLVMLLPHGYEGQGPEHSSARLERFLQQCSELNLVVLNPTTPANLFHAFRRQLKWNFRKPMVIMTPKSGLRHPEVVSKITDLTGNTRFKEIIVENDTPQKIRRVLLCTGKIYFDLIKEKRAESRDDVHIIRIEQLYPLPFGQLKTALSKFDNPKLIWVQEEPENMGAWNFICMKLRYLNLEVIARKSSASPATGFKKMHDAQQMAIVKTAFKD